MPRKILYGRTSYYQGKPLIEILANLPNFGIGRTVMRNVLNNRAPDKKNFMVVRKVEPWTHPDHGWRYGRVMVDKVIRGERLPETQWYNAVYKSDWVLVPKDEEHLYQLEDAQPIQKTVLPRKFTVPPLMDLFLKRRLKDNPEAIKEYDPVNGRAQISMVHQFKYDHIALHCRLAEGGEKPDKKMENLVDLIDEEFLKGVRR